jgi:hypothetical protein
MPAQTAPAEPKHPLYAMTTYERRDYRRQLESNSPRPLILPHQGSPPR